MTAQAPPSSSHHTHMYTSVWLYISLYLQSLCEGTDIQGKMATFSVIATDERGRGRREGEMRRQAMMTC